MFHDAGLITRIVAPTVLRIFNVFTDLRGGCRLECSDIIIKGNPPIPRLIAHAMHAGASYGDDILCVYSLWVRVSIIQ